MKPPTLGTLGTMVFGVLWWPGLAQAQGTGPAAPALDGAYSGSVTAISHPRGWFTFEVPQGWSVSRQTDDAMLINPGLNAADSLDALVVVSYGELEPAQAQMDVAALFPEVRAAILEELASQSIAVSDSAAAPRTVRLAHAIGLVQEWPGKAGKRDVHVWFGGLVKDGHYLTATAVVVAGQEHRFVPGMKRLLYSTNPRPPQRNTAAEQALAGARFASVESPGRGSFSSSFEFSPGLRVKKTMMMSGMVGLSSSVGGDTEEWGTYEVTGDQVTITFQDSQDTLKLVVEQGQIVGLDRDGRTYRRR